MPKPRVFIASSKESQPLITILKRELSGLANVVSWNDPGVFRAGQTFLDDLVRLSKEFDLGVFLYEKDDHVVSRGVASLAPRDNVIFEHGLFMSQLGRYRAFAIAPRGGVKVLSDLSGIKLLEYEESSQIADLRRDIKSAKSEAAKHALGESLDAELTAALEDDVLQQLKANLVPLASAAAMVRSGPPDVIGSAEPLAVLMTKALKVAKPVVVEHLGLDLEVAWAILRDRVLADPVVSDVHWRCLMTDPESRALREAESDSVSLAIARERVAQIRAWCANHARAMSDRNVVFECRTYAHLPMIHGFLVKNAGLLWSTSDIRDGRLNASRTPYFEFADSPANAHMIQSYSHWFGHFWENGGPVWPESR
jgi:hypothetical protein